MGLSPWRVKHGAKLPAHHLWTLLSFQHVGLFLDSNCWTADCPCTAALPFGAGKVNSKGLPKVKDITPIRGGWGGVGGGQGPLI